MEKMTNIHVASVVMLWPRTHGTYSHQILLQENGHEHHFQRLSGDTVVTFVLLEIQAEVNTYNGENAPRPTAYIPRHILLSNTLSCDS